MKPSEPIHKADETDVLAAFIDLDKGAAWTDHHTLAIVGGAKAGLDHVSFECRDFDDIGMAIWRWAKWATNIAGESAGIFTAVRCSIIGPIRRAFMSSISSMGTWSTATRQRSAVRLAAKRCFSGAPHFQGCELAA